jgi:hypothetical protein
MEATRPHALSPFVNAFSLTYEYVDRKMPLLHGANPLESETEDAMSANPGLKWSINHRDFRPDLSAAEWREKVRVQLADSDAGFTDAVTGDDYVSAYKKGFLVTVAYKPADTLSCTEVVMVTGIDIGNPKLFWAMMSYLLGQAETAITKAAAF